MGIKAKMEIKRGVALLLAIIMLLTTWYCPEVFAASEENNANSNTYSGNGYEVTFSVNSWSGAYNADITIKNVGESVIEDWCIIFPLQETIETIWNAKVEKLENGMYTIKNVEWNQDIAVGSSVSFGFSALGDFSKFPELYSMVGEQVKPEEGEYSVEYKTVSDWGTGFAGQITITNTSGAEIEDWTVEFDFDNEISNIWDAKILNHTSNHYVIGNASYNQNIGVNQKITFGFTINNGSSEYLPVNCVLYKYENSLNNVKLSINTENLVYDNSLVAYKTGEKVLSLNGTLAPIEQVNKLLYRIENRQGQVINEGELSVSDIWEIAEVKLTPGYNDVTLTAHTLKGEEISQTIAFYLEEESDLNFDRDYMLVEGAYSQLAIGFQENDTEQSVTKNIELPSALEGVAVCWISSDPAIVDNSGMITRPEGKSAYVTLTADLTSGSYSKTKEFQVYVVKDTYIDYNTDYIEDADSFEFLYAYNEGDLENLEVFLNEEGNLQFISGSFSDIVVESPQEAILALYGIKTLMGSSSPADEIKWVSTNKTAYGSAFRFEQVYKGIPVYGSSIVVGTDGEGITSSFQSTFVKNINLNIISGLTEEDAAASVNALGLQTVSVDGLYIYINQSVPVLVWNVSAKDTENNAYNCLIDANSGSEVYRNSCNSNEFEIGNTFGSGNDEFGAAKSFPIIYFKFASATNFTMRDPNRNISVYDMGSGTKSLLTKDTNTWTPDEISSFTNVIKSYDFYHSNFGRRGFDNFNSQINVVIRDGDNIGNSYNSGDTLNFGTGGSYIHSGGAAADTVGHEYTHGVVGAATSLGSCYRDAPGAINEGYADIFGYFIEGDNDPEWLHREDNTSGARALRNMSNPSEFGQPSAIGDSNYYDFTQGSDDNGGVHTNNTIVSHACYLMWENGISDKARLASLWYQSLLIGYGETATFNSVRQNVLAAARNMRMVADEIQIIKNAFDSVGVTGGNSLAIDGSNTLSGKVVTADLDTVLSNNTPLSGATVTIVRSGSNLTGDTILNSYKFAMTETDGTFYFTNIVPGTYKLTISKDGYYKATQMITLTNTNLNNYGGIVELIPTIYVGLGFGAGTVKDSVTGSGVAGLNLTFRSGINTKVGTVVSTIVTDKTGSYLTEALPTGHYCVEVKDKRTLPEGEKSYITTYFNIKILGPHRINNQNATVSTSLNENQLRIVLQWGAAPRDLDSHLVGPTSTGGTFHISYSNKKYSEGSTIVADLDLDDTTSYGPETTTIYNPVEGKYTFFVYNYSGSPSMSTSGAYVQVYSENANEPSYTFNIPTQSSGRYWTVFTYDSATRKITPVNAVGNSAVNVRTLRNINMEKK